MNNQNQQQDQQRQGMTPYGDMGLRYQPPEIPPLDMDPMRQMQAMNGAEDPYAMYGLGGNPYG